MKKIAWTEWAAIAEVIGTLGIVVSLVFVAMSINKGTDESIASQTTKLYETARQIELAVAADPEWVTAVIRGRNPDMEMSEVDRYRYDAYVVAQLDLWDEMLLRNDDRLLNAEILESWDDYFTDWVERTVTAAAWQRVEWNFTDELIEKAEAVILD